jgi:iron-sulfur cluster repair protein YtfE (RIC family)
MANVESIANFFEEDHRKIDAVFERLSFKDAVKDQDVFEDFDQRLEMHIHWEEDVLFPAIASINQMIEQGPVRIMKLEHEAIRHSKTKAKEAFVQGDLAAAQEHCEALRSILSEHNLKEERVLYPICDQSLDEIAITQIFSKLLATKHLHKAR